MFAIPGFCDTAMPLGTAMKCLSSCVWFALSILGLLSFDIVTPSLSLST